MVDAVLYLEGERYQHYRVLRAAKNRFGSTNELGVFEMTDAGLREVPNPSAAFLSESARAPSRASAVVASLEGSRPLLVEVQALVSTSFYGTPQRVTSGFDPRRLAVLLAVLERRVGLRLGRHDVFVTVTGGLTLDEPGTDLGVALAIASSFRARPVLSGTMRGGRGEPVGRAAPRAAARRARARGRAGRASCAPASRQAQAADARGSGSRSCRSPRVREAIERLLGERRRPVRERGRRAPARGRAPGGARSPRAACAGARAPEPRRRVSRS